MIIDAFDDRSPAKIKPPVNPDAPEADAVIFTFSHAIEQYVVTQYTV